MATNQRTLTDGVDEPVIQIKGDTLQIRQIPGEQYLVINQTKDTQYVVDGNDEHCTCEAFKYTPKICKHIEAVKDAVGESEAGEVPEVEGSHHHSVETITCPDCGGDAVAGQYEFQNIRDTKRRTRILCPNCETIREEDNHSSRRDL